MSFRLLDVYTGKLSDHSIDSSPQYLAASHAWSEHHFPAGNDFLLCPGRSSIVATINQRFPTLKYCWVDTIRIKQNDESDKLRQIPLMGQIFENAVAVLIILDCKLEVTQDAIDEAQLSLREAVKMHEVESWQEHGHLWQTGQRRDLIVQAMKGLVKFTATAWTTRIWTLQEYILGQSIIWIGNEKVSVLIDDILFAALPDICNTLDITEAIEESFSKLYSYFSGMANCRLKRLDQTRVMELLGNRQATVPVDEVYGVMAASGVSITPKARETKELAWTRWLESAISQGHVRWLMTPTTTSQQTNCIFPAFEDRHLASSSSDLDTVQPLGTVTIINGTVTVMGRSIGSCVLRYKLGPVHEPIPNRIHRDVTLVLFGRGKLSRALRIASAFGAGRYDKRQTLHIALALVSNWYVAVRAVRLRGEDRFRMKTRFGQQTTIWNDFMAFQMGQMPGMNAGVAFLASIVPDYGDISLDAIVALAKGQKANLSHPLKVIDLGARTIDKRCIFMIVDPTVSASGSVDGTHEASPLHKVAVTLPVTGDFEDAITALPLERFLLGGDACKICMISRSAVASDAKNTANASTVANSFESARDRIWLPNTQMSARQIFKLSKSRPYGTWSRAVIPRKRNKMPYSSTRYQDLRSKPTRSKRQI